MAPPRRDPNFAETQDLLPQGCFRRRSRFRARSPDDYGEDRGAPRHLEFYIDEGDEQYLSAIVDRSEPPQRVRFYRIRRRNLPETEQSGNFADLVLAEQEGLAESIHIVLFDEGVIGSEYNHYGPGDDVRVLLERAV